MTSNSCDLELSHLEEADERPDNLLLVGPSGNGKTMILRRFAAQTPRLDTPEQTVSTVPTVCINAPEGPDLVALYRRIIEATGEPVPPSAPRRQLQERVYGLLRDIGLRLLVIDDLHNALHGPRSAVGRFATRLRLFGDELGISLVCAGTREAAYALRTEDQLFNRFPAFALPRWQLEDTDYLRLLNSFARVLPLRRPSRLAEAPIALRIMGLAEGLIGEIALILRLCAIQAIRSGHEAIDLEILESIDYQPLSKRRDLSGLD